MASLDPCDYDFMSRFPVPNDEERHRAGRQGMLDQKADARMSDGDWIAYQHDCWAAELRAMHKGLHYLRWAESRGVDTRTGRAPREAQRWPAIRDAVRAEVRSMEAQLRALLDDYANHFGVEAADRFGGFVMRTLDLEAGQSAQVELF